MTNEVSMIKRRDRYSVAFGCASNSATSPILLWSWGTAEEVACWKVSIIPWLRDARWLFGDWVTMRLLFLLESWFGDCGEGDDAAGRDGTLRLSPLLRSSDTDGGTSWSLSASSRWNESVVEGRLCVEISDTNLSREFSWTVSSDRTYMGTKACVEQGDLHTGHMRRLLLMVADGKSPSDTRSSGCIPGSNQR